MIAEIGHFALILALVLACATVLAPFLMLRSPVLAAASGPASSPVGSHDGLLLMRRATQAQFLLLSLAMLALTLSYIQSDFSLVNVVRNSHADKPLIYRITGVWANHEGSMLLWGWVLALSGAAVSAGPHGGRPALLARMLAVHAALLGATYSFILFVSNPFLRSFPAPEAGRGMNPLLQDPGIALHPPMLYLGYVGLSVCFSLAVAGLLDGRIDRVWARLIRPWLLASWVFLTAGIALGSWWAYYELGWGGFWFWDPVENASLMPWLASTALLHTLAVLERRNILQGWTVLLAILAFSFSLTGTFLVRSGVLTSVHSFANDPERGIYILALLALVTGGALLLYAVRGRTIVENAGDGKDFEPLSREGGLVLNNLVLVACATTVLVGTLYPLALELFSGRRISVGPPYFNQAATPMLLALMVLAPAGALLSWRKARVRLAAQRLWPAALACLAGAMVLGFLLAPVGFLAWLGLVVGLWGVLGSLAGLPGLTRGAGWFARLPGVPLERWGMVLAHAGVGLIVLAVSLGAILTREDVRIMQPGEQVEFAGYTLRLAELSEITGPNWLADQARLELLDGQGRVQGVLLPQKRRYIASGGETTEAAIRTRITGDLYLAIGETVEGGQIVRFFWRPFVLWMWIGAVVLCLGGSVALLAMVRRRAVGRHSTGEAAG